MSKGIPSETVFDFYIETRKNFRRNFANQLNQTEFRQAQGSSIRSFRNFKRNRDFTLGIFLISLEYFLPLPSFHGIPSSLPIHSMYQHPI